MGGDTEPSVFHQALLQAFLFENRYLRRFFEGHNSVTDLGLLKNGFSQDSSLKPKSFDVVPVNGPTGRGWPLPQAPKPK